MSRLRARAGESETGGRLAGEVSAARVHDDVTVPRTSVRGKLRLLTRAEAQLVDAEARTHLRELGYAVESVAMLVTLTEWHSEIATRTIAVAVRDPEDVTRQLAPLADWRECDDDQIAAVWQRYQDLQARLDPLGAVTSDLTDAEVVAIREAAKKKDVDLLMSYGSRRLALYLRTTAGPLPN